MANPREVFRRDLSASANRADASPAPALSRGGRASQTRDPLALGRKPSADWTSAAADPVTTVPTPRPAAALTGRRPALTPLSWPAQHHPRWSGPIRRGPPRRVERLEPTGVHAYHPGSSPPSSVAGPPRRVGEPMAMVMTANHPTTWRVS